MSKVHGQRRFKWMLLWSGIIFLPLLIGLGFWQLDRAGQKAELMQQWQGKDYIDYLPAPEQLDQQSLLPVKLSGHFDTQRFLFLDNRTRNGKAGYEVIALFTTNAGALLVNLGWAAANVDRAVLPNIEIPDGLQALAGSVRLLRKGFVLSSAVADQGWPRLVQQLEQTELQAAFAQNIQPLELRLHHSVLPQLDHQWAIQSFKPQRHLGYAVQWFAMALALLILILWGWRASNREVGYEQCQ